MLHKDYYYGDEHNSDYMQDYSWSDNDGSFGNSTYYYDAHDDCSSWLNVGSDPSDPKNWKTNCYNAASEISYTVKGCKFLRKFTIYESNKLS